MQVLITAAALSFSLTGLSHHAPSTATRISQNVMQVADAANKPPPAMPALAATWGCDEETWNSVKNKRSLVKLCKDGDEEHFKTRLAKIKGLIADAPPPSAKPVAAVKTRKAKKAEDTFKQRKSGPYEAYGAIPDDLDVAAITARVNERAAAKEAKDYALADSIREELAAKNIRIRDDFRTFAYKVKVVADS